MGYSTEFFGELKFKKELKASELGELKKYLQKDRRDIGFEDNAKAYEDPDTEYWYHIDLELNDDFSGLKWDESEKTYGLDHIVNFITRQMRLKFPDFELEGELQAQGEEYDDRWILRMVDGRAIKIEIPSPTDTITCPHCDGKFSISESLKASE